MKGQWQGKLVGYATGHVTVEIDDNERDYSGRACIFQDGISQYVFVVEFRTTDKAKVQHIRERISAQRVANTSVVESDELQQVFPNILFPDRVELTLTLTQKGLRVAASTYVGAHLVGNLDAVLNSGSADKRSKLAPDRRIKTWEKFKVEVGRLEPDRFIFRGQPVVNRLRSSFHRTNRRDLNRFSNTDIPMLHGMVSSKTRHYFDLRDNIQNASFWNLLQHHGYPTPLLDWSHSPYVAAYFAFRNNPSVGAEPKRIRIFKFDRVAWQSDFLGLSSIVNVMPHFSILAPISLENPRALPQQAICSITTVDDVESYLDMCGKLRNKTYLSVYELPYTERSAVLTDLRLMGVAAGSLFPGIDGACEEMRLKNFGP